MRRASGQRAEILAIFLILPGCGARTGLVLMESDDDGAASAATASGNGDGTHVAGGGGRYAAGGVTMSAGSILAASGGTPRTTVSTQPVAGGTGGVIRGRTNNGGSRTSGLSTGGVGRGGSIGRGAGGSSTGAGGSSTGAGGSSTGAGGSTTGAGGSSGFCPAELYVPPGCNLMLNEALEGLCNGLDDNCDGNVDEGCPCTPGTVKPCFAGAPGRRNVGACRDGLQACETTADRTGRYGKCLGGIAPQAETCDQLDNDCNGCRDELRGCIPSGSCPGPGDARIAQLQPFSRANLNAADFYDGDAIAYAWSIAGGPCDQIAPLGSKSFELFNPTARTATFVPKLSGDYTVTFKVTALSGESFSCNWVIPVRGPGLRVEMCYPESAYRDLDLYLKRLSTKTRWFTSNSVFDPNFDECAWHNCEASLRGGDMHPARPDSRVEWGYPNSPISECVGGPQGSAWLALGYCANPRLDIDNNQSQAKGMPENINIDQPNDGDGFRIMVYNFSGDEARPIVNVYCGGNRVATYGAPPDVLPTFVLNGGGENWFGIGTMWRVADVTTHLDDHGTVNCNVTALHPPGSDSGYLVTSGDPSF